MLPVWKCESESKLKCLRLGLGVSPQKAEGVDLQLLPVLLAKLDVDMLEAKEKLEELELIDGVLERSALDSQTRL